VFNDGGFAAVQAGIRLINTARGDSSTNRTPRAIENVSSVAQRSTSSIRTAD